MNDTDKKAAWKARAAKESNGRDVHPKDTGGVLTEIMESPEQAH